jgi:hypothetical protein
MLQNNYMVSVSQILHLVSDQENGFALQISLNAVVIQVSSNVCINSRERVIQKINICFLVHSSVRFSKYDQTGRSKNLEIFNNKIKNISAFL